MWTPEPEGLLLLFSNQNSLTHSTNENGERETNLMKIDAK